MPHPQHAGAPHSPHSTRTLHPLCEFIASHLAMQRARVEGGQVGPSSAWTRLATHKQPINAEEGLHNLSYMLTRERLRHDCHKQELVTSQSMITKTKRRSHALCP